jgi:hypothetical protein
VSITKVGSGYTLVATADTASTRSAAFDITTAAAYELAFITQPSHIAAGGWISPAVQVAVVDRFANVVTSFRSPITLRVSPDAPLTGNLTVSPSRGVASFPRVSIEKAGPYQLVASAAGLQEATSDTFQVSAGSPALLEFSVQPVSTYVNELIPQVEVSVLDAYRNLVTSGLGLVTVEIGYDPNKKTKATLSGILQVSPTGGVAQFSNLRINQVGVGYQLGHPQHRKC